MIHFLGIGQFFAWELQFSGQTYTYRHIKSHRMYFSDGGHETKQFTS